MSTSKRKSAPASEKRTKPKTNKSKSTHSPRSAKSSTKTKELKPPLHENFRDYTPEEIIQIKKDVCIKHQCPYLCKTFWPASSTQSRSYSEEGKMYRSIGYCTCNYIDVTKHSRECMPDQCTHWKDKNVHRKPQDKLFKF